MEQRITYRRPWLAPYQLEAMFCPQRISLIEASTKSGKTHSALAWLYEQAMLQGQPGRNFWWVAPIVAQAQIAFLRLLRAMTPGTFTAIRSGGKERIILMNGATIWFRSAENPDSLYGDDVFDVVVDEASRTRELAWGALRTTLSSTGGRARIIGNVKGRKNWFWTMCRIAERGEDPELAHFKITAEDAIKAIMPDGRSILQADEVASARRSGMPEWMFRELYLAEAADDGGNPFGLDKIAACATLDDLSDAAPTCWGWDLAKQHDWTVGVALDSEGRVCRFLRFHPPSWEHARAIMLKETGTTSAYIDSTGLGDPILEDLQRKGGMNFEGFKFTQPSKQQLMEGLMAAIHGTEIRFPRARRMPEGAGDPTHLVRELESFEFDFRPGGGVRYSALEGLHDDCVMALALAQARRIAGGLFDDYSWVGTVPRNPHRRSYA